jgi:hypothetical protein
MFDSCQCNSALQKEDNPLMQAFAKKEACQEARVNKVIFLQDVDIVY